MIQKSLKVMTHIKKNAKGIYKYKSIEKENEQLQDKVSQLEKQVIDKL